MGIMISSYRLYKVKKFELGSKNVLKNYKKFKKCTLIMFFFFHKASKYHFAIQGYSLRCLHLNSSLYRLKIPFPNQVYQSSK